MAEQSMSNQRHIYPATTIIGKDLDAGATFNADLDPSSGVVSAGRFMSYDETTKLLTPWDATADAAGATIFGVLSDKMDVSSNTTSVIAAAMVYREGTFLRQEIEEANQIHIPAGGPLDKALRDLGITLEYSYEGYEGLDAPPGAGPIP
jgi:hypothetical protein